MATSNLDVEDGRILIKACDLRYGVNSPMSMPMRCSLNDAWKLGA